MGDLYIDQKGYFVDIHSENARRQYRTFTSSADLAEYINSTKGPHVIIGGNSTQAKQEAAKIVRNTTVAVLKHSVPSSRKQWAKIAQTAVEVA